MKFQVHNAALLSAGTGGAVSPQRLPEEVRTRLNPRAMERCRQVANSEIRFFLPPRAPAILKIESEGETDLEVFFGDFQSNIARKVGTQPIVLDIRRHDRLAEAMEAEVNDLRVRFHPGLTRVCLTGDPVWIHLADGPDIRVPQPDETPSRTLICCGTSITHGVYASSPHLSYPALVAERMGWDVLNLGLRGSMFCEAELADHVAGRGDWDAAIFELSANMVTRASDDDFFARVSYFTKKIASANPDKPIIAFSLLPHFRDLDIPSAGAEIRRLAEAKRLLLKRAIDECDARNLHFIDGRDLLPSLTGLSDDLLHLGDSGFRVLAEQLTNSLRKLA